MDQFTSMVYNEFGNVESVMVGSAVDLPLASLGRLCPGEWLDMWLIAAAMELLDKPSYVRYGLSVPLHSKDGGVVPTVKPFGLWRKKIDNYRKDSTKLVFFCPLNLQGNHFTLLEINEQRGTIFHYDSLGLSGSGARQVKRAVEVRHPADGRMKANMARPSSGISTFRTKKQ